MEAVVGCNISVKYYTHPLLECEAVAYGSIYNMKNIFSSKRSIVIAVSVLMAAVICCIGVLMYQNYILSHTVNGKLINEQDYIGLTREEATKELNKDGLIIKVEEINGNKHTIHTAEGSCNGFMWVTIRDNYITKARFETGDPSC